MVRRMIKASVRTRTAEDGFSLLQLLVVLTVAAIVSALAVISIQGARRNLRRQNSARQFAGYLEKARADSVRRRARVGFESSVQLLTPTSYRVTMGFGGSSTLTSRDFNLEPDVIFQSNLTTLAFDWRGRPTTGVEKTFALNFVNSTEDALQVDVTGAGDVTIGSEVFQDASIPNSNLNSNMSGTGDVAQDQPNPNATPTPTPTATPTPSPTPTPDPSATPTPTPNPSATPTPTPNPSATPTPTPNPSATPTPTPTPSPVPCLPSVYPSSISLQKGGGTATVSLNLSAGGSGNVTVSGPGNLIITPTSRTMNAGQPGIFTIQSGDNTRGEFTVTFTTPCGSTYLIVTVTN